MPLLPAFADLPFERQLEVAELFPGDQVAGLTGTMQDATFDLPAGAGRRPS